MAVQRMKFVTLAAPVEQFDQVALRCVIDQQFHPENAQQVMRQVRHLRPLAGSNQYTAPLRQAEDALLIDTTGNTLEESIDLLQKIIRNRLGLE